MLIKYSFDRTGMKKHTVEANNNIHVVNNPLFRPTATTHTQTTAPTERRRTEEKQNEQEESAKAENKVKSFAPSLISNFPSDLIPNLQLSITQNNPKSSNIQINSTSSPSSLNFTSLQPREKSLAESISNKEEGNNEEDENDDDEEDISDSEVNLYIPQSRYFQTPLSSINHHIHFDLFDLFDYFDRLIV